jgi:HEAT repeat protein
VTATGSIAGLDALRADAVAGPGDPVLRRTLEAVRGPAASEHVAGWLADPDRRVRAAALEMLAGCGEKSVTPRVKPFLDEQDNTLRIAAINALRGIVDGEQPLDRLPVFEAIELAKRWKERV